MSRGNTVIINGPEAKGKFEEIILNDTSKPGTIMQIDTSVTKLKSGHWTWKAANTGTDGKAAQIAVLLEDKLQGFTFGQAGVAGTLRRIYYPLPGEDINCLLGEVAGTGNTYAVGDRLILDAEDGILVPESGSPQATIAVCCEILTQVAGSALAWVKFF